MRIRGVLLSLVLSIGVTLVLSARGGADVAFPLQANSVRFAAIGDMGTGDHFQSDVARQMVESHAAFPFEFAITLGDNIYTGSAASDFDDDFACPTRRCCARVSSSMRRWETTTIPTSAFTNRST